MSQATPDVSRNPAVVITLKGRKYCDAAEIAALAADDARRRKLIGREIEELLRIRREAGEAAHRLIQFLDLDEPDADYEPSFGGGRHGDDGMEREADLSDDGMEGEADFSDDEPSLGWTHAVGQDGRKWQGLPPMTGIFAWGTPLDAEAEHDGREPDADLEPDADDEPGGDDGGGDVGHDPAYFARLKARRNARKAVRP